MAKKKGTELEKVEPVEEPFAEFHHVVRARRVTATAIDPETDEESEEVAWLVVDPETGEETSVAEDVFLRRYEPHIGDAVRAAVAVEAEKADGVVERAVEAVEQVALEALTADPVEQDVAEAKAVELGEKVRAAVTLGEV